NLALDASGSSHSGQVARMVSRQYSLPSFLSSSAIAACAQTSSTEREAWAAEISTPRSGAHPLHKPRFSFQQRWRQTQLLQRGHCTQCARTSTPAASKASSRAFCQLAERTRSPRSAARPNTPPKLLEAASSAPLTIPTSEA